MLLNLVRLSPGEALRLGPGNLHAYLHGAAIELMGPSDNVVRAGLTNKPVDVDELLRIVDATPLAEPVVAGDGRYRLDDDVQLARLEAGDIHRAVGHEVSIDLSGEAWYLAPGDERLVTVDHLRRHQLSAPTAARRQSWSLALERGVDRVGAGDERRRARVVEHARTTERACRSSSTRPGRGGPGRRR